MPFKYTRHPRGIRESDDSTSKTTTRFRIPSRHEAIGTSPEQYRAPTVCSCSGIAILHARRTPIRRRVSPAILPGPFDHDPRSYSRGQHRPHPVTAPALGPGANTPRTAVVKELAEPRGGLRGDIRLGSGIDYLFGALGAETAGHGSFAGGVVGWSMSSPWYAEVEVPGVHATPHHTTRTKTNPTPTPPHHPQAPPPT